MAPWMRLGFWVAPALVPGIALMTLMHQRTFYPTTLFEIDDSLRTRGDKSNTTKFAAFDNRDQRKLATGHKFFRYHEIADEVKNIADSPDHRGRKKRESSYSAYSRAEVVQQAPWMPGRKMCKETCCVETVAISLDQDEYQIIKGRDGIEVADLALPHGKLAEDHLTYHAETLHEAMLPCLVPGTIITLENHQEQTLYFWHKLRQYIQVPYILLTTGSDGDSPEAYEHYIADPLLIRWYGANPINKSHPLFQENIHKFRPFNLGLSYQHPQERHLQPYLELNMFSNPFLDKRRWDFSLDGFNFTKDVFVHFGLHRAHRRSLWKLLCPANKTTTGSSCNPETKRLRTHKIYTDMSHYRFGISPTGVGYDCYRTYEMLLLGIIPIIEERLPWSNELFEGLPIIQMPNLDQATSKQQFMDAIKGYIESESFQNASFAEGWERLFLKSRRQMILHDSQRDLEILVDKHGKKYYQAYKYSIVGDNHNQSVRCKYGCEVKEKDAVTEWFERPSPGLDQKAINWLRLWEEGSRQA